MLIILFKILKFSPAKLLFLPLLLCNAGIVNAGGLYKVSITTLGYVAEGDPARGSLSGFFIIDPNQVNGDSSYTNNTSNAEIAIPSWITQASLTFTSNSEGFPSFTNTLSNSTFSNDTIDGMIWKTANGTFDPTANFEAQMTSFGFFSQQGRISGPAFGTMEQQIYDEEFLLNASTTTEVPGPLPILGTCALYFYYRKLKNKTYKL